MQELKRQEVQAIPRRMKELGHLVEQQLHQEKMMLERCTELFQRMGQPQAEPPSREW